MKTPRELLLGRHAEKERQLDRLHEEIIAEHLVVKKRGRLAAWLGEWFWPSPIAWGAVAAAWMAVIVFFTLSLRDSPPAVQMANQTPAAMEAVRERVRMVAELTKPSHTGEEPVATRPRSDRRSPYIFG